MFISYIFSNTTLPAESIIKKVNVNAVNLPCLLIKYICWTFTKEMIEFEKLIFHIDERLLNCRNYLEMFPKFRAAEETFLSEILHWFFESY